MSTVEIYTKATCPYCHAAKRSLTSWNIPFEEHPVDNSEERKKVIEQYGHETVPVIVINGELLGGNDDLQEAKISGLLDELLKEKH